MKHFTHYVLGITALVLFSFPSLEAAPRNKSSDNTSVRSSGQMGGITANTVNMHSQASQKEGNSEIVFKNQIGEFIRQGNILTKSLFKKDWQLQTQEVEQWEKAVVNFLSLQKPYLISLFQSESRPNAIAFAGTSMQQTRAIKYVQSRVERLSDILMK